MSDPTLHVHVWEEGKEDPTEEGDLEYTGLYYDGDEFDHIQFTGTILGKHIELRLFRKDLPFLTDLK